VYFWLLRSLLGISVKTAESHRSRLIQKLDIHHETASLVLYAVRHGIVQPSSIKDYVLHRLPPILNLLNNMQLSRMEAEGALPNTTLTLKEMDEAIDQAATQIRALGMCRRGSRKTDRVGVGTHYGSEPTNARRAATVWAKVRFTAPPRYPPKTFSQTTPQLPLNQQPMKLDSQPPEGMPVNSAD
jgi:hypothetical protein